MSARKNLTAFLNECMIILLNNAGILKEVASILEPFIKLEREIAAEEATARATEKMAKVIEQCIKNTIKIFRKEHASRDEITEKLLKIFPLEKDEAAQKVDLYWNC